MAEWVSVEWLMKNLKVTIDRYNLRKDSEWFRMMRSKTDDKQFATIIRLIEENGFTDPIGIRSGAEFDVDDKRYYDIESDDDWVLGNGHHRLVAAILLGLDSVLVEFGNTWPRNGDRYLEVQQLTTSEDEQNSYWISNQVADYVIGYPELVTA